MSTGLPHHRGVRPADAGDDRARAALEASHLGSLPAGVLAGLTVNARRVRDDAGAVLEQEGLGSAHLDVVVSGLVRVYVTAPDGRTMTVRYVRPGGLLGALSLFASPPVLPATSQAATEVELLRLSAPELRRAAATDVRVARVVIDEITERVHAFISEIAGSAFATVRQRVARHLLDLASPSPGRGVLVADVGQQELADAVGTVREVVVRELRQLREAGLVRTGRAEVVILDSGRLAAEAFPAGPMTPETREVEHVFLTQGSGSGSL